METMFYSVVEVAKIIGISKSYAYELIRRKEIPAIQIGSRQMVPKEKFNIWINQKIEESL